MEQINTYKTIQSLSEGFYREKGSRFIAYAVACSTEGEIKHYLEQWRKDHHQARHLCWAYRIGEIQQQIRTNDDGEPSNSAGQPILRQIRSFELTNVLVGVIRYFGGIKLGVAGLTNAYKEASYDALNKAQIIEMEIVQLVSIKCNYEQMPKVMTFLKTNKIHYQNSQFDINCTIEARLPIVKNEEYQRQLISLGAIIKWLS